MTISKYGMQSDPNHMQGEQPKANLMNIVAPSKPDKEDWSDLISRVKEVFYRNGPPGPELWGRFEKMVKELETEHERNKR